MPPEDDPPLKNLNPRTGFEYEPMRGMGVSEAHEFALHSNLDLGMIHMRMRDVSIPTQDVRGGVVDFLAKQYGLTPIENDTEKEEVYERYRWHIASAQIAVQRYLEHMLVNDLYQRTRQPHEIATTSDPLELIDILHTKRDSRIKFLIRQILHFGGLSYQYEKTFGAEEERTEQLHDFGFYIDSLLFPSLRFQDGTLYHRVKQNEFGDIFATAIRTPLLRERKPSPQKGENFVPVNYRIADIPDSQEPCRVIADARVKEPFSAILKAIQKGESITDTRDVLGVRFYVDDRSGNELHLFVKTLLGELNRSGVNISGHEAYRSRGDQTDTSVLDPNTARSSGFQMEKFVIEWQPSTALGRRQKIDLLLARLYKSPRAYQAFWERAQGTRDVPVLVEIQIGTIEDYVNNELEGDALHSAYKAYRASEGLRGDTTKNILEILRPKGYFDIDFVENGPTRTALRRKYLTGIGLHRQILDELDMRTK